MTKSGFYWAKVLEFRRQGKFNAFCEWSKRDPTHLREEWRVASFIDLMGLPIQDIPRLSTDSFRPLLRCNRPELIEKTLQKIRGYITQGNYLTRTKTQEFLTQEKANSEQSLLNFVDAERSVNR